MNKIKVVAICLLISIPFVHEAIGQEEIRAERAKRMENLAKEAEIMFESENFSGVKIFRMKGESYLLAFGSVPVRGSMSVSTLDRAASAQARKEVMKYNDGITITEDMVITIDEGDDGSESAFNFQSNEVLTESGTGIVSEMQTLCTFQGTDMFVHVLYLDLNGLDTKRDNRQKRREN